MDLDGIWWTDGFTRLDIGGGDDLGFKCTDHPSCHLCACSVEYKVGDECIGRSIYSV